MYLKNQLGKTLASVLLLLALILPTAIQFSHMIEGHESDTCNELSTHIHKSEKNCDVCDFHFTSISYDIAKYPDLLLPQISVKLSSDFTSLQFYYPTLTSKQLRAPPVNS